MIIYQINAAIKIYVQQHYILDEIGFIRLALHKEEIQKCMYIFHSPKNCKR